MATVNLSVMLPEVQPYVHDCPRLLAENAIRNAAIEFCHKTQLWRYDVPAADIIAGTAVYTPTVPANTVLVEILWVWRQDTMLPAKSDDELMRLFRMFDWRTEPGTPIYHNRQSASTIQLVPAPNTTITGGLTMRVALAPARAATTVDADIVERFTEVIAKGAIARLLKLAGQPFFDPAGAATAERLFQIGINEARIKANRSYSRAAGAVGYNGGFL